jgi:hypothetical protein
LRLHFLFIWASQSHEANDLCTECGIHRQIVLGAWFTVMMMIDDDALPA